MRRWKRGGLARSFSDEAAEEEDEGILSGEEAESGQETTEADYSFEGYSVDFIDRIAFMPAAVAEPSRAQSRYRARP